MCQMNVYQIDVYGLYIQLSARRGEEMVKKEFQVDIIVSENEISHRQLRHVEFYLCYGLRLLFLVHFFRF